MSNLQYGSKYNKKILYAALIKYKEKDLMLPLYDQQCSFRLKSIDGVGTIKKNPSVLISVNITDLKDQILTVEMQKLK